MAYQTKAIDDAFPWAVYEPGAGQSGETGLTKREFFAALAMVGMLASEIDDVETAAQVAADAADRLIKALNAQ